MNSSPDSNGYEDPQIIALQNLSKRLNPDELKGTIIMVYIANVPASLEEQFSILLGKKDGTLTGCIAGWFESA